MATRTWGTTPDGRYEFVSLTNETLPAAMNVMRRAFFGEETVSIACELPNNPEAAAELEDMIIHAAEDGVSIIAVEAATGEVAAAAINIFELAPQLQESDYFIDYQAKCKTPNAKYLLQFMIDMGNELDIFKHYQVDVLLEIMFMATLKEHRGHGLAKALFQCSIELAKQLKDGNDVRTMLSGVPKPLPLPKLVTALCSSFITQKIAQQLGFENLKMVDFHKWTFNGRSFADVIGPETPATSIDCFVLK